MKETLPKLEQSKKEIMIVSFDEVRRRAPSFLFFIYKNLQHFYIEKKVKILTFK